MNISPKIFAVAAGIIFALTLTLMIFNHDSFIAGIFSGFGLMLSLIFVIVSFLQVHLQKKIDKAQEQMGDMLGFDVKSFLEN